MDAMGPGQSSSGHHQFAGGAGSGATGGIYGVMGLACLPQSRLAMDMLNFVCGDTKNNYMADCLPVDQLVKAMEIQQERAEVRRIVMENLLINVVILNWRSSQ